MPHIDPNIFVQPHNFHTIIEPAEPGKTMVANPAVKEVILDTIKHERMTQDLISIVLKYERERTYEWHSQIHVDVRLREGDSE